MMLEWIGFLTVIYIALRLIVGGCALFWLAFTAGDPRQWSSLILLIVPATGVALMWLAWVHGPIAISVGLK